MQPENLFIQFYTGKSPLEVFNAINNVKAWWSETIDGTAEQPGDAFVYQYKTLHKSTQKVTEWLPGEKVVWLVTDGYLSFVKNEAEWLHTRIIFEIVPNGTQTELRFTHEGITPACECFGPCSNGWATYISGSLQQLINTGTGNPDKKN